MRMKFLALGIFTAFLLGATVLATPAEAKQNKATICHIPPGNPDNAHTITVSNKAVRAHLRHGDTLGACPSGCLLDASQCDDQNFCTDDVCLPSGECAHQPVSCDDSNVCTQDICVETEGCVYIPADGVQCDDDNSCTDNDYCQNGACAGTSVPGCCLNNWECDDADLCSTDICGSDNTCVNENIDCSFEDMCFTGLCDPSTGGCVSHPVECDDGDVCTDDFCDAETGCMSVPTSNPPELVEVTCDDGIDNDCDGAIDSQDNDCIVSLGADLSTDLSDTPDPVLADTPLTYTISWTNNGPDTASQATAFLVLDPRAALVSFTLGDSCDYLPPTHQIDCTFFNVAPNQTLLLRVVVLPEPDPNAFPELSVTYDMQVADSIDGIEVDTIEQNDSDAETTTVFTCISDEPCLRAELQESDTGELKCVFEPVPNNIVLCSAPCFSEGICVDGICELGEPIVCEDSPDQCFDNFCNPVTGACETEPLPGVACAPGNLCAVGLCDATGECVEEPIDCNDADSCTIDSCNPDTGACENDPIPECGTP